MARFKLQHRKCDTILMTPSSLAALESIKISAMNHEKCFYWYLRHKMIISFESKRLNSLLIHNNGVYFFMPDEANHASCSLRRSLDKSESTYCCGILLEQAFACDSACDLNLEMETFHINWTHRSTKITSAWDNI